MAYYCGSQVKVGDILHIKRTVIQTNEGVDPALSCILIKDCSETCQVGFIALFLIDSPLTDPTLTNIYWWWIYFGNQQICIYLGVAECLLLS